MGMYDSIKVYLKCPYCGHIIDSDAQTKDLGKMLRCYSSINYFFIDDFLHKGQNGIFEYHRKQDTQDSKAPKGAIKKGYVNVVLDCQSTSCQFDADRRDILRQGNPSGGGRFIEGKLLIKKGCFISELKDIELDGYTEKYLSSYKRSKKNKDKLKKLLPQYKNQEVIAVRNWRRGEDDDE